MYVVLLSGGPVGCSRVPLAVWCSVTVYVVLLSGGPVGCSRVPLAVWCSVLCMSCCCQEDLLDAQGFLLQSDVVYCVCRAVVRRACWMLKGSSCSLV